MFLHHLKYIYFKNFCYSFFSSQLWDLQHRSICQFDILWHKAVRRIWHLPYTTHCNLLPAFAFGNNFCSIIHNQFVNFLRECLSSNNVHIKFVALLAAELQMHVFGKNLFYMSHMNLPAVSSFASVACELCVVKLGYFGVEGFTFDELNIMFSDICCN